MKIFTIGVYGKTEKQFFSALTSNNIDVFCDIRQRRGVRGKLYTFANSIKLQHKLHELGIHYLYEQDLAPTRSAREKQWEEDKAKKTSKKYRTILSQAFISCYCEQILASFDFETLKEELTNLSARNVVLFCVEANAEACHRSLLAERLAKIYNCDIINL